MQHTVEGKTNTTMTVASLKPATFSTQATLPPLMSISEMRKRKTNKIPKLLISGLRIKQCTKKSVWTRKLTETQVPFSLLHLIQFPPD